MRKKTKEERQDRQTVKLDGGEDQVKELEKGDGEERRRGEVRREANEREPEEDGCWRDEKRDTQRGWKRDPKNR